MVVADPDHLAALVRPRTGEEMRQFLAAVGMCDPHGVTELKIHRSDAATANALPAIYYRA
jgi:hypothetical protein